MPTDISQQIFYELVSLYFLIVPLKLLEIVHFRSEGWMDVISYQGSYLLFVDLSDSEIIENGLVLLKDCSNLEAMTSYYYHQVCQLGMEQMTEKFLKLGC